MKKLTFVGWMLFALPGYAVTCAAGVTHIVDPVLMPDGVTAAKGTIAIRGPSAPGGPVAGTITVTIASGVDFCLAGGPGWKYEATFKLVNSAGRPTDQFVERWIVPETTRVLTRAMLWGGSSAPEFRISPQQINPAGLTAGQVWVWDGTSYVPGTSSGGSTGDGTWGGGAGTGTTWGG